MKKNVKESFLKKLTSLGGPKKTDVIYGLYDAVRQPLFVRFNDFLIDHSRVSLQEKAYFFQLLAVMVDAGIPLIQGLKMLAGRAGSERFRRVINTVAFTVSQGKTLSDSMARFSDVFSEVEIGVVRAGEAAGNLDKMLNRVAEQLSRSHELQVKLVSAMIYPVVVLIVLFLAASGMLVWVIPTLLRLLTEGGLKQADFPVTTRLLINFSNLMTHYWWAVFMAIVLVILLIRFYLTTENGRYHWDFLKLKIPVVGALLRKVFILRFVSIFGILIESGLPVVSALTIVASALQNQIYRLKMFEVIAKVQQGEKISGTLAETPFLFPETVVNILAVGEQSASVGFIAGKIARQYDMEIDYALKRLMSLLEPLLVIFVGFSVALLALAILTPIFRLTQLA